MDAPAVVIVLLNWNGWRDTHACLGSLAGLDYPNYEVVVVDNASTDGSEAELRKRHPKLTLLQSGANLGFAGGNNVGLRSALAHGAEYVWLLNNDTLVEPDALSELVGKMQREPDLGLCGSTLLYESQRGTVQALGGARYNRWLGTVQHVRQHESWPQTVDEREVEGQLDYLIGASMIASKTLPRAGRPTPRRLFPLLRRTRLGGAGAWGVSARLRRKKYRVSQGGLEYRRYRPGQGG